MPSYFNKTLNYLKRNGVKNTYYAVMERLTPGGMADYSRYTYQAPDEDILKAQRESWQERKNPLTISLVVPAYETKQAYLTALMDSVLAQTWESWELILADASTSDVVEQTVAQMAQAEGVTEELKASNPMMWTGLMNNLKHQAEEVILAELIHS